MLRRSFVKHTTHHSNSHSPGKSTCVARSQFLYWTTSDPSFRTSGTLYISLVLTITSSPPPWVRTPFDTSYRRGRHINDVVRLRCRPRPVHCCRYGLRRPRRTRPGQARLERRSQPRRIQILLQGIFLSSLPPHSSFAHPFQSLRRTGTPSSARSPTGHRTSKPTNPGLPTPLHIPSPPVASV